MAYSTLFASVPEPEVEALQQESSVVLRPEAIASASHLLAYWVQVEPLGSLLNEAIDGGEPLAAGFHHPLRPPMFHRPAAVCLLAARIDAEVAALKAAPELADDDWYLLEISRMLKVFRHAASVGNGIVTALQPPADDERARLVRLPWEPFAPNSPRAP